MRTIPVEAFRGRYPRLGGPTADELHTQLDDAKARLRGAQHHVWRTGHTIARAAVEDKDALRLAQRDAAHEAISAFLLAWPRLAHEHSTHAQQAALQLLLAINAEYGGRR